MKQIKSPLRYPGGKSRAIDLILAQIPPDIAEFRFANILEWQLQYGMNNYGRSYALKGNELFIKNY